MARGLRYLRLAVPVTEAELLERINEQLAARDETGPVEVGEKVAEEVIVKLAFASVTRIKGYDRGDAQEEAKEWMAAKIGKDMEDITNEDVRALPRELNRTFGAMWQAADIIAALVLEECEIPKVIQDWFPPEKLEDWADVRDWLFQPALQMAWQLNPHWISLGATEGN